MDSLKPAGLPHVFPDGFLQNNGADMVIAAPVQAMR